MKAKRIVLSVNVLLVAAAVVHVGICMYLHAQHPEYSAPASVELLNAVFYLVPIIVIDVVYSIVKKCSERNGAPRRKA